MDRAQNVTKWAAGGLFLGTLTGASSAMVSGRPLGQRAVRVGVNCGLFFCVAGGINEAVTLVRGGQRDALNLAFAGGVTGFLASIQKANSMRAGLVGLICASVGVGASFCWDILAARRLQWAAQRRQELGLAPRDSRDQENVPKLSNDERDVSSPSIEPPAWLPMRRISDEEIEERRSTQQRRG